MADKALIIIVFILMSAAALGVASSSFDMTVSIPDDYKTVVQGGELLSTIKLVNIGSGGRIDVTFDFEINDASGHSVLTKRETVAVETQASFVRTFSIPQSATPGLYTINAKLIYADGTEATASASFEVIGVPTDTLYNYIYYAIPFATATAVFLLLTKSNGPIERLRIHGKVRSIVRKKGLG